jgi:predicted dehydrogenase
MTSLSLPHPDWPDADDDPRWSDWLNLEPSPPVRRDWRIGAVGAGFIMRDCHLPAYAAAGLHAVGIVSRHRRSAEEVAALHGVEQVYDSLEQMLDQADVEILDVAVPPQAQRGLIERAVGHRRKPRGILAQKPLAMSPDEGKAIVQACQQAGVRLQVNQNMRFDQSIRGLKTLLDRSVLGEPVLATIDMRAIPHWMPWAQGGRSLATYIMSIHHLDTFRYWLGDPDRVLASTRPDPRTSFDHHDGINLAILEYDAGPRASTWDDVWSGPSPDPHREGPRRRIGQAIEIRWRVEGTRGVALGTIGWPDWPQRRPSTLRFTSLDDPHPPEDRQGWRAPVWSSCWFPDAFRGPLFGLARALETHQHPDIDGADNLKTLALCEAVLVAAREHRVVDPRQWW